MRYLLLFLTLATAWAADPVDQSRLVYGGTWEGLVGVSGGIPARTTIYTNLTSSASAATINSAIDNCPSNQVVMLGAGTYTISSVTLDKDGVTLRGTTNSLGVPTTILNVSGAGIGMLTMAKTDNWVPQTEAQWDTNYVLSGYTRGSTQITVASTPGFSVDQILWLTSPGGGLVVGSGFSDFFAPGGAGADHPMSTAVQVTQISGTDVTFTPPLNANYSNGQIRVNYHDPKSDHIYYSGFEDISLTVNGATGHFVDLSGTVNCWVKNVWTDTVPSGVNHIRLQSTWRAEIRDCDLYAFANLASDTYHIRALQAGSTLIVNNHLHGGSGNLGMYGLHGSAFAYNYTTNVPFSGGPFGQIVFFHGSHSHYNLFEGNVSPRCFHDEGSRNNTWFRNFMRGWDGSDSGKRDDVFETNPSVGDHDNLTVAGCIMGTDGQHTTYNGTPGNNNGIFTVDAGSDATLDRLANYNAVNDAIPAGEALGGGDALVTSYLFSSKPAFFGFLAWPYVDPFTMTDNTVYDTNLPAGWRWAFGSNAPSGEAGGGEGPAVSPRFRLRGLPLRADIVWPTALLVVAGAIVAIRKIKA